MVLSALVLVNIVFVYLLVPISITFRVEKDSDAHRYCDASWQHCSGRQYVAHAVCQSLCADIFGIDGLFDGFDDSNHVELPTQPASANGSEAGTVMARECLTSSKIDGPTFDNGHTYIICWYAAGQYSCLQWSDHHLAADLSLFHCQRINRHHRVVDNQKITGTVLLIHPKSLLCIGISERKGHRNKEPCEQCSQGSSVAGPRIELGTS